MNHPNQTIHEITLARYTLKDFREIFENRPNLMLSAEVRAKIDRGDAFVKKKLAEGAYIYGVTSGFGSLCETEVHPDELEKLQYNHIVSHACGVGDPVSEDTSRLTLFNKLLTFRTGHTGISIEAVDRLIELWNNALIPVIPKKGTVGASGDLAPLAHLALPLLGLGQIWKDGAILEGSTALEILDRKPLRLSPKDGLALTNGVQYINGIAVQCLLRFEELVKMGDLIAALSLQAFSCSETFYDPLYHRTSPHKARMTVARNLSLLAKGGNHAQLSTCNRSKQDPYSFRCGPQVHGAVRQAFEHTRDTIEDECNGVSDNPLFFPEENKVLFGGNLHGESTALSLDFLALAVSELANISERRTYQLLSGQRGLPSFLVRRPGVNSGLMVAQYTSAALVNENKVLCTPASIDTIPTCQLQEDHVSMGGTSAYKLEQILDNLEWVLAIEMMTAAQAVYCNSELRLSQPLRELVDAFREVVAPLEEDRVISKDIEQARIFLKTKTRPYLEQLA